MALALNNKETKPNHTVSVILHKQVILLDDIKVVSEKVISFHNLITWPILI